MVIDSMVVNHLVYKVTAAVTFFFWNSAVICYFDLQAKAFA